MMTSNTLRRGGLFASGLIVLALAATIVLYTPDDGSATQPPDANEPFTTVADEAPDAEASEPSVDAYGIPERNWDISERTIRRNQTFAHLLQDYGLSYQQVVTVAQQAEDIFDVRRLRSGRTLHIYSDPQREEARYAVYEAGATRYVVYDLQEPENSYVTEREVEATWKRVSGPIHGSLYNTMVDQGAHPELVVKLADVFAWQIDFFQIRAGDRFEVIYEERSIEGERIRPGDVIAARLVHRGTPYYAFRFQEHEEERAEYYDEHGNSLRREFLRAPLEYTRISSGFTNRRLHPVTNEYRAHHGVDYAAPTGTPIRAIGDGVVEFAARSGGNGNYVRIRHNSTYTSGYLHMSRFADGMRRGKEVEQGEVIGYVGATGLATGPHLCFRIWKHGDPVNPLDIDLPPAYPVGPEVRDDYFRLVDRLQPALEHPQLAGDVSSILGPMT